MPYKEKEKYIVSWTDICGEEHTSEVWAWDKMDAQDDIDPSMASIESCIYSEDNEDPRSGPGSYY